MTSQKNSILAAKINANIKTQNIKTLKPSDIFGNFI
jgi:hypothetical protein